MSHLPNYLRMLRKRWALTQQDLADLFGVKSQSTVSHYENHRLKPGADTLIAAEVVFGVSTRDLFPKAYGEIEDEVLRRAKLLHDHLETRDDLPTERKRELLTDMIMRAEARSVDI